MMNKLYILLSLLTMLMVSCNKEEERGSGSDESETLIIPIQLYTDQPLVETRTPGDPGKDDKLTPPVHLYAWACLTNGTVEYKYTKVKDTDWQHNGTESADSRYSLTGYVEMSLPGLASTADASLGKVYVIASEHAFSSAELYSMYGGLNTGDYDNGYGLLNSVSNASTTISNMTFTPTMGTDILQWNTNNLRDLYSNPVGDETKDSRGMGNGEIKNDANGKHHVGTVRLYHCAAKVDFQWEVLESLQASTSVESITCTGLPTALKVFEPTNNPNGDGTCSILGDTGAVNELTPANKYIGRAYAYVLQPADNEKKISYTVTFNGGKAATSDTKTPAAQSGIYTTWYRVRATVK